MYAIRSYYANHQVESEGEYDQNGKRNGTWTYYFNNGDVITSYSIHYTKLYDDAKTEKSSTMSALLYLDDIISFSLDLVSLSIESE